MAGLQWEALPPDRVTAIEDTTGPIVKAETVTGGLMPGLAAVIHTDTGQYFVKGAPADSPACHLYQREAIANAALPSSVPAPPMLLATDAKGWLLMVFAYINARTADLSPGSPDLPAVLAALEAIGAAPAATAPPVSGNVTVLQDVAAALLGKQPGGHPWDMYRAATNRFDPATLAGDRLVHYDLHPGNLKVTSDSTVTMLDWAFASAGAPWTDATLIIPRLIEAGHAPADAEHALSRLPAWQAAPPEAVTALAALWTMYREHKALHGPYENRAFRAQAASAGRSWITHRMS